MSVLIVSRTESKLQEQVKELLVEGGDKISVQYLTYDFTKGYVGSAERTDFYARLDKKLEELHNDGGVGLLVNNVGMANPAPKQLMEMPDSEVDDIINCNVMSVVGMTRAVLKYMKMRDSGAVLSISSGSGNFPASYLVIYSATKAFMTQFSRSMTVEHWGTGIDFLVVTPFYVVSNLYKRRGGTLVAPMPIKLIEGSFSQLGKQMVWQGHGYWFHGLLGTLGLYYPDGVARNHRMMIDNRKRYDLKMASKAKEAKAE
jgi:17beta-estradiol 17-dehydrogenase / very-long-chain 3-oxoacyl-CoA reductase